MRNEWKERGYEWIELSVLTQAGFCEDADNFTAREKKGARQIEVVATIVFLEKRKHGFGVQL